VVDWVTEFKIRYTKWGQRQVRSRSEASPKEGRRLFHDQREQAATNLLPNPATPHPKVVFGADRVGKMDTLPEGQTMWATARFATTNINFPEVMKSDDPELREAMPMEDLLKEVNGLRATVAELSSATRLLDRSVSRDINEIVRGASLMELNVEATDAKVVKVGSLMGPKPGDVFDADVVTVWDGIEEAHGVAAEAERQAAAASADAKAAQALMSVRSGTETRMADLEKRASKFQRDYREFLDNGVKKYIGPAAGKVWRDLFPRGGESIVEKVEALQGQVRDLLRGSGGVTGDPYGVGMGVSDAGAPVGSVVITQPEWRAMQGQVETMRASQALMEKEMADMRRLLGAAGRPESSGRDSIGEVEDRIKKLEVGLADIRTKVESESFVIAGQRFDGFDDCPAFVRAEMRCQVHLIFDVISFNHATRKEFVDELTHVTETDKYARARFKNRNEAVITAACKTTVPHPYAKKTEREDPLMPLSGLPSAADFGYQLADGRHHVILEAMGRLREEINQDLNATLGMLIFHSWPQGRTRRTGDCHARSCTPSCWTSSS